MDMDIEAIVRKAIPDENDYFFGFANLENLLDGRFREYGYGITIEQRLDNQVIDGSENGPTRAYYNHRYDVNSHLLALVNKIAADLRGNNINSLAIPPTTTDLYRADDYPQTLRQKFSHKMVGTRAGLGWIGKTDLFISERFGPRVRLASVLTSQPLPLSRKPVEESRCGDCRICVDACPAQAANGKLWNTSVDRDEFYDAFRCREKTRELALRLDDISVFVCGACVRVCPIGQK